MSLSLHIYVPSRLAICCDSPTPSGITITGCGKSLCLYLITLSSSLRVAKTSTIIIVIPNHHRHPPPTTSVCISCSLIRSFVCLSVLEMNGPFTNYFTYNETRIQVSVVLHPPPTNSIRSESLNSQSKILRAPKLSCQLFEIIFISG